MFQRGGQLWPPGDPWTALLAQVTAPCHGDDGGPLARGLPTELGAQRLLDSFALSQTVEESTLGVRETHGSAERRDALPWLQTTSARHGQAS